jgi:hypothetical protein
MHGLANYFLHLGSRYTNQMLSGAVMKPNLPALDLNKPLHRILPVDHWSTIDIKRAIHPGNNKKDGPPRPYSETMQDLEREQSRKLNSLQDAL